MKSTYLYLILLGFLFTTCNIDRQPHDLITESDVEKNYSFDERIQRITAGNYSNLKKEYFVRSLHYIPEYGGDNIALSGSTTDALMFFYNYQRIKDNYLAAGMWREAYITINGCNKLTEMIKDTITPKYRAVLGENLYIRGFVYFSLVNAFARPYAQSPNTNLGVPIKLSSSVSDLPSRSTVKQVYDQILNDLLRAERMLSSSEKNNNFASTTAAQALLSRVYLYMGNWSKAEEYAKKVIDSNKYSLLTDTEYQRYPQLTPEDNKETIFAIRFIKDRDNLKTAAIGSLYANINGMGWGEMYASLPYRNLLAQNPTDLRHSFIQAQFDYVQGTSTRKPGISFIYDALEGGVIKNRYANSELKLVKVAGIDRYEIQALTKDKAKEQDKIYFDTKYVEEDAQGQYVHFTNKGVGIINQRYNVKVQDLLQTRQEYPKYFIYKCSLQEGQDQLYSPIVSRLGEMFLNRAEANFHLGFHNLALADLNVIRNRAQVPTYTLNNLPAGMNLLDLILQERRIELAFEGHRKYDIFRNGLTLNRQYPGTHDRGEALMQVPPTSNAVIEYIPQTEIDNYLGNLVQNP